MLAERSGLHVRDPTSIGEDPHLSQDRGDFARWQRGERAHGRRQLGHSRVSMTQDPYLGRRAANAGNLAWLETHKPAPVTDEQLVEDED
jgi:hypothetical protein